MKRVLLVILAYFITLLPAFAFSEIDDVASIEAQTKGEYKKIENSFYLKGIKLLDEIDIVEEDKNIAAELYNDFENEYYLSALSKMDNLKDENTKKVFKAVIYAALNMTNSAEEILQQVDNSVLDLYKGSLHRENKLEIFPYFGLLAQDLDSQYDLDYQKWGINTSKKVKDGDLRLDYRMTNYYNSNRTFEDCLTNYIRLGYERHSNPKWEYSGSVGGKFFEYNGKPLIIGDIWTRYRLNDKANIKIGASRETVEQSYITAIGDYIDGDFTGRATSNEVYFDINLRFKKDFYFSIKGSFGLINGANLPDNFGFSGYYNFGKRLYNNAHNPYIQKIDLDITTYSLGYSHNLLQLSGRNGTVYGGYFSPRYYNATAFNIRFEGEYKNISYGLKGFIGEQISTDDSKMTAAFGVSPYLKIKINNRLYLKTTYSLAEFAGIKSNLFSIGLIFRI